MIRGTDRWFALSFLFGVSVTSCGGDATKNDTQSQASSGTTGIGGTKHEDPRTSGGAQSRAGSGSGGSEPSRGGSGMASGGVGGTTAAGATGGGGQGRGGNPTDGGSTNRGGTSSGGSHPGGDPGLGGSVGGSFVESGGRSQGGGQQGGTDQGGTNQGGNPGTTSAGGRTDSGGGMDQGGSTSEDSGGTGAGGRTCMLGPSCNWCGGEMLVDGDGCYTGYRCANGADPCYTQPCIEDENCGDGKHCGADELCWPDVVACTALRENAGFIDCDEGYTYRREVVSCTPFLPRDDYLCSEGGGECQTDDDCLAFTLGHCSPNPLSMGVCTCYAGCMTDADCEDGYLCACRSDVGVGQCTKTECESDADCEGGYHCASYSAVACGVIGGYACQSAEDECIVDTDCDEGRGACQMGEDGHRVCDGCAVS